MAWRRRAGSGLISRGYLWVDLLFLLSGFGGGPAVSRHAGWQLVELPGLERHPLEPAADPCDEPACLSVLEHRLLVDRGRMGTYVAAPVLLRLVPDHGLDITFDYGFFRCLCEFTLGLALYQVWRAGWLRDALSGDAVPLLLLAALMLLFHRRCSISARFPMPST